MGHPQANGQVEVTNKILLDIQNKKLLEKKWDWANKLPGVLWPYKTTTKTTIGRTSFSLVYRSDQVATPIEIRLSSHRVRHFNEDGNEGRLEESLDLLKEDGEYKSKHRWL